MIFKSCEHPGGSHAKHLTNYRSLRPHCEARSVCLPRHPAVASLYLVRSFAATSYAGVAVMSRRTCGTLTAAFPRRAFESANHSAADRTWDRGGAALE